MIGDVDSALRRMIREEVQDAVKSAVREAMAEFLKPPAIPDLVTVRIAAESVSLAPSTIRGWLNSGELKRYGQGRNQRVSRSELMRHMETQAGRRTGLTKQDAALWAEAILLKIKTKGRTPDEVRRAVAEAKRGERP